LLRKLKYARKIRQKSRHLLFFNDNDTENELAQDTLSEPDSTCISHREKLQPIPAENIFSLSLSDDDDGELFRSNTNAHKFSKRQIEDEQNFFRKFK